MKLGPNAYVRQVHPGHWELEPDWVQTDFFGEPLETDFFGEPLVPESKKPATDVSDVVVPSLDDQRTFGEAVKTVFVNALPIMNAMKTDIVSASLDVPNDDEFVVVFARGDACRRLKKYMETEEQ